MCSYYIFFQIHWYALGCAFLVACCNIVRASLENRMEKFSYLKKYIEQFVWVTSLPWLHALPSYVFFVGICAYSLPFTAYFLTFALVPNLKPFIIVLLFQLVHAHCFSYLYVRESFICLGSRCKPCPSVIKVREYLRQASDLVQSSAPREGFSISFWREGLAQSYNFVQFYISQFSNCWSFGNSWANS